VLFYFALILLQHALFQALLCYAFFVQTLPVFPLPSTVVFPGMTIPLYIFEERYRKLVQYCKENNLEKFIITLASKELFHDNQLPFAQVGTLVSILESSENADGTFTLLGHGQCRCKLNVVSQEEVPERDGSGTRPLHFSEKNDYPIIRSDPNTERLSAWDTLDVFRHYAKTFFAFDALNQIEEVLPEDLVYQASFICANIRVPAEERQALLEAASLTDRFKLASALMEAHMLAYKPPKEL